MQVLGIVISVGVDVPVKKKDGGSYKGWELIYKSDSGDVRTIAKPIQGLTYNAPLKKALSELSVGEQFTLEQEKNAGGFYDVKTIVKGWVEGSPQVSAPATARPAPTSAGNYQASSYPTADERKATQRFIVRQSSLAQAVATLTVGAKSVDKEAVKTLAEEYADFVFETKRGAEAIADIQDDIPY